MAQSAVLTGDLIGSTHAGAAAIDAAMAQVRLAAQRIGAWTGQDTRFTRFRGDGWQIHLTAPGLCLRACLYLTAILGAGESPLATRISVGLGPVDSLGSRDLSDAAGTAFRLSGKGLDTMHRTRRFALSGSGRLDPFLTAILSLAEFQSGHWSREQAEAVALALDNPAASVKDYARPLGISRQAMQARLKGAGFAALSPALLAFERCDFDREVADA